MRHLTWFIAFILPTVFAVRFAAAEDAVSRLTADRLEAVHQAVLKLRAERKELPRKGPLEEYRANLHVHSSLSHDSRGTIEEIVTAAKAAGTQVLLFTEHPAEHYDFFKDGHQGTKDGVLLVPGAEMKGLLVFPRQSVKGMDGGEAQPADKNRAQDFSDLVRRREGLTFLSHLEERMDWELRGLSGVEIYNTHADFKDEKRLLAAMKNPLWLFTTAGLFRKYPQEALSALQDYPADYLRRWDELCQKASHTGIAANDAHQNIGLIVRLTEEKKARFEDASGKKLIELDAAALADVGAAPKDAKPGDVLFQIRLDPYENSLLHVGTHLLMSELSAPAVWQALERGRAFVAFDWLADSRGFDFAASSGSERHEMGSRIKLAPDLQLSGQAPLPAHWKVMCNGKLFSEADGEKIEMKLSQPGNYRAELWLDVAGEKRIWILSNPIYVTAD